MKKIIDVFAYIGFYFIGGVMFLYQSWEIVTGIIFNGVSFNNEREVYYGRGVSDSSSPIDLDMMKWWFLIGVISAIYLLATGQLEYMANWFKNRKK